MQGYKILLLRPSIKYYSLESIGFASPFVEITKSLFILIHKIRTYSDTNFQMF